MPAWAATTSSTLGGTGSGWPRSCSSGRLAYARASSIAKNGLPSVASASRISTGRGSARSRRLFTSWYRAASERGWGAIRSRLSSGNARDSPRGSSPPGSARLARSRPSCGGSRRNANVSACSLAGSSHCTSSMATSTGSRSASVASRLTRAVPVSRPSAPAPGSARRSAEASARSWTAGSELLVSSNAAPTRSASAAYERSASLSAGRARRTRRSRFSASRTASSQTVVFPIPAWPSMTTADSPCGNRSRKPSTDASSCSRPTNVATVTCLAVDPTATALDLKPAPAARDLRLAGTLLAG